MLLEKNEIEPSWSNLQHIILVHGHPTVLSQFEPLPGSVKKNTALGSKSPQKLFKSKFEILPLFGDRQSRCFNAHRKKSIEFQKKTKLLQGARFWLKRLFHQTPPPSPPPPDSLIFFSPDKNEIATK